MNRLNRRSFLGVWGAGAALALRPAAAQTTSVSDQVIVDDTSAVADTESGKVMGYIRGGVRIFMGIPYGEVLSPEARWARAARPRPWTGKRSSRAQGPVAPPVISAEREASSLDPSQDETNLRNADAQPFVTAEDCLRINVYTPGTDNKKRPVMVWLHGGGFYAGSPLMTLRYEPHNLSRHGDVVVVSMTHRLNALGFLDLTAYGARYADSANLGMLDIIDALKWVRTNIGNFGGDPGNVLIFGQSGGGGKVAALLAMPEAKGLFHKAIMESPGSMFSTQDQSTAFTAAFLKLVNVSPNNIEALHKLPVDALMRAAGVVADASTEYQYRTAEAGTGDWQPVVDGRRLLFYFTQPKTTPDVPLIMGSNLHESFNALGHPEFVAWTEAQAREVVNKFYGPFADGIYDVYKGAFPKATPFDVSCMARAVARHRARTVKGAQRRAALGGAPTYNYWFHWRSTTFGGRAMSHHELEIPFVFLNTDAVPMLTGGTPEARALALKVAGSWLDFARSGNPGIPALPAWNPVTPAAMNTMVFDNACRIDQGSDLAAVEMFWKRRYPNA